MYWIFWKHYLDACDPTPSAESENPSRLTSRPQTETQLYHQMDTIARLSNHAVCIFDNELDCVYLSSNWKKLSGYATKECLEKKFWALVHTDFQTKVQERLRKAAANASVGEKEQPDIKVRCQIMHKEGNWHWYEFSATAMRNGEEEDQIEFICFLQDITAEVQTQKKLQHAKLEAELALKSRSEFLANMSHELRTPLNAVIGFAQIMQNQLFGQISNPKYLEYLANIQDSAFALLSKINDLLEVSNLEAGKTTLCEEYVDVTEIIRYAIEIQSHNAFAAQISIREALLRESVIINVDRVKMKQVISNILSNAIKYSKPGDSVEMRQSLGKDRSLTITITDNGTGISSKHLNNILTAFQHEDGFFVRSTTNDIGLGLAIAKEFMTLHGGDIRMESEIGLGTKVTLTLPGERVVHVGPVPLALEEKRSAFN